MPSVHEDTTSGRPCETNQGNAVLLRHRYRADGRHGIGCNNRDSGPGGGLDLISADDPMNHEGGGFAFEPAGKRPPEDFVHRRLWPEIPGDAGSLINRGDGGMGIASASPILVELLERLLDRLDSFELGHHRHCPWPAAGGGNLIAIQEILARNPADGLVAATVEVASTSHHQRDVRGCFGNPANLVVPVEEPVGECPASRELDHRVGNRKRSATETAIDLDPDPLGLRQVMFDAGQVETRKDRSPWCNGNLRPPEVGDSSAWCRGCHRNHVRDRVSSNDDSRSRLYRTYTASGKGDQLPPGGNGVFVVNAVGKPDPLHAARPAKC